MSYFRNIAFVYSSRDYLVAIAEDEELGHKRFSKVGYTPTFAVTDNDLWSAAGVYVWPTAALQWAMAAGNAADLGVKIKGNAEGANQTILCEAGGTTTELNDADGAFTDATAVAIGDLVLVSPKGDGSTAALTPEFGYVTAVAATKLTFAGGLSSGGTCAVARAYTVVDKSDGTGTGAQVVYIEYLTSLFAEKKIFVLLNGGAQVDFKNAAGAALTDTYRLNGLRIIAVGTGGKSAAAIALRLQSSGINYGYITAGFTRARGGFYTVPAGKKLYVNEMTAAYGMGAKSTLVDQGRFWLRATQTPGLEFPTPGIFYPFTEIMSDGGTVIVPFLVPLMFRAGVDVKISGMASTAGSAIATYRGYTEVYP